MTFSMQRMNPITEHRELNEIWGKIFPNDPMFPDEEWNNPLLEAYWVVQDDVKIGFTILQLHATVADTYVAPLPREDGTMYILMVGLLSDYQGKGIGSEIKQWHIRHAKALGGFKRLVSNHRRSNKASFSFNARAGYKPVGEKPNYYPEPLEDSIVMELTL